MLTKETVEKVSHLARLALTESEIVAYAQQLSAVLESFEKLSQVGTENVAPLITPSEIALMMREDQVLNEVDSEALLENAQEKSGRLFKVPPVV